METGGTFQLRRRWPRMPGRSRLPARGSKCSGHLAAVKGCPFGRNSRPESAGPGRDVRPLPQLPLQRVETSLEQPLLGHRAHEHPPRHSRSRGMWTCADGVSGGRGPWQWISGPPPVLCPVGTLLGNGPQRPGRAMEGEPGNATEAIKGKPSPSSERQRLTI